MGLLTCTRCKVSKPSTKEFFPLHNKKINGLDSWCRACRAMYRSSINRGRFRKVIKDKDLIELKTSIDSCVICGSNEKLVVDHCHETEQIRGILCTNCNLGLGHFKDDPLLLEFAIQYLNSIYNVKEFETYLELHS